MKECIILGGGTSLKELEHHWDKIEGKDVWSLNSAWKIMPFLPTREIWVDKSFFKKSLPELIKLHERGVKLYSKEPVTVNLYSGYEDMITVYKANRHVERYTDDITRMFIGGLGLSGVFALSLAIHEGYERIFLCGYDFGTPQANEKQTHVYQNRMEDLRIHSHGVGNLSVYRDKQGTIKKHLKDFDYFLSHKDKILNVSLFSNIHQFKKVSYEKMFDLLNNNV